MKVINWFTFLLFLFPMFASASYTSRIYDIDNGSKDTDDVLILLETGEVLKLKKENKLLVSSLFSEKTLKQQYNFQTDTNRFITKISKSAAKSEEMLDEAISFFSPYVPTTVASMEVAQNYHRSARHSPKNSQCFNRAHIWSYEWWKNHSLRSMKILIFFTRNYIRKYNFEWWFHIAPYIHVMDNGKVVERVMDVKYTRRPVSFKEWTDIFMRNNASCPVITKYSEYADYPYHGDCYIFRTNMYTYQPADLQMNEAWGYTKSQFLMDEVKGAYLEAFDIRLQE